MHLKTQYRRVGVIGDAHCHVERIQTALRFFEKQGTEEVFCVGDIVDGPGDADRTCEILAASVKCVAGNHERWLLDGEMRHLPLATLEINDTTREFLTSLPVTLRFSTLHGDAIVCHGVGEQDEAELRPETRGYALQEIHALRDLMLDSEITFMIGGHTHEHMVRVFPGLSVINAGTIHSNFDSVVCTIDFETLEVGFFPFNDDDQIVQAPLITLPLPEPLS